MSTFRHQINKRLNIKGEKYDILHSYQAAHLILGYKPISSSFQTPKCVIKSNNPRLHRISVAIPGFLLPEGVPALGGTLITEPIYADTLATKTIF